MDLTDPRHPVQLTTDPSPDVEPKWSPTGFIGDLPSFELSAGTWEAIRSELRHIGIAEDKDKEFFDALEMAGACYLGMRTLHEGCLPSKVKRNLKSCLETLLGFNDQLNALDGKSKLLLAEAHEDRLGGLKAHLSSLIDAVSAALNVARGYPLGRPPDFARKLLANAVAWAFKETLDVNPPSTKGGVFDGILARMLKELTVKTPEDPEKPGDTSKLVLEAVREVKRGEKRIITAGELTTPPVGGVK